MKRKQFLLLLILLPFSSLTQQRIGLDLSSRLININATINYQRVIQKQFLLSAGFSFGRYGWTQIKNTHSQFAAGFRYYSPFDMVNQPVTNINDTVMYLYEYDTKTKGMYFQIGLGYFHEINIVHGLRFNGHFKLGIMRSNVFAGYWDNSITNGALRSYSIRHLTTAISPELYHTIRLGGRTTLYYGMKVPYYFSLNKSKFNPQYSKDMFNSWEPEISLGLTYVIGRCD